MIEKELLDTYINRCEQLGQNAAAKGNAPVGCIIIRNDKIIAEAEETATSKQDVTCHAEIEAIRIARQLMGKDMSDCTMISTHEPCIMCAYAIRFHGIKTVIYKNEVKFLGSVNSKMDVLNTIDVPGHWSKPPKIIQLKR
ncbi:MAG: nucleoside deaminase [Chitinophagales bacterium]|nr:nucleoside deaminase [Chitinophagales bacterium]